MLGRVLLVVAAFFAVGGLLVLAQRRGTRVGGRTAWNKYVTYGLFLVTVLAVAALGEVAYAAAVVAILVMILREFGETARLPRAEQVVLIIAGLMLAGAAALGGATALYPLAVILALVTLAVGALASEPRAGVPTAIWVVTGIIAVATPAVHLLLIARRAEWFALFAFLFLVVSSSDAFAELAGKRWSVGRGLLRASPGKSLSGLLGGLVGALTMAVVLHTVIGVWTLPQAGAVGLLLWVAATLGDLIASSLKRALGAKDFGTALPGHGGVLDRFDSLIFAACPFCWVIGV
jgi:phosphatidate cytidylyltransferase